MTPGRFGAAIVAVLALTAAWLIVGPAPASVEAAVMCPPVTIDDLFPPNKPPRQPTPTTVPGGTSTTTTSTSTTTTTTMPDSTSTSVEGESTTTTLPGGSTSPVPTPPRPGRCDPFEYAMSWPVLNRSQVISTFGADRDHGARHHEGIDIHAPKMTPVVAVADGRVAKVTQLVGTDKCCSLVIRHDDGWQSVYVHLNNDLYGTDDGMGIGVRPDLEVGDHVMAGEVVGWVGDSGNAEDTVDHLHFELRTPAGVAVDPAPSLRTARRAADFPEIEPTWPYIDDEVRGVEWIVGKLLTQGLFTPCDEVGLTFCPEEVADPEFVRDVARFLASTEPPPLEGQYQEIQVFEPLGDEQRVINEAMGCPTAEPCLDFGITESELARVAAWVTDRLSDGVSSDPDNVIDMAQLGIWPSAGEAEADLKASGLIEACRPPLDDEDLLSRERVLMSLVRWVIGPAIDCLGTRQGIR